MKENVPAYAQKHKVETGDDGHLLRPKYGLNEDWGSGWRWNSIGRLELELLEYEGSYALY